MQRKFIYNKEECKVMSGKNKNNLIMRNKKFYRPLDSLEEKKTS